MGRRATNTVLLRARVPQEVLHRTELRIFEDGERKYGAMSDLITSLLIQWLNTQDSLDNIHDRPYKIQDSP